MFRKTEVIVFKSSVLGKEKAYKAESAIYDLKMTFTFLQYTSQNLKVRKRAELCIHTSHEEDLTHMKCTLNDIYIFQ